MNKKQSDLKDSDVQEVTEETIADTVSETVDETVPEPPHEKKKGWCINIVEMEKKCGKIE